MKSKSERELLAGVVIADVRERRGALRRLWLAAFVAGLVFGVTIGAWFAR